MKNDQPGKLNTVPALIAFADKVQEFISTSQSTDDMDALELYLAEMRSIHATLSYAIASAEVIFGQATAQTIEATTEETWKKIKGSSTLVLEYAKSKFPNEVFVYSRLKELKECIREATTHYSVLVAFKKEEMRMHPTGPPQS